MDRHILTALFAPASIVVFAGDPDAAEVPTPLARTLRAALAEGSFKGQVFWLDAAMTGTLSDLAHSRADLALIALPEAQILPALEIVGRLRCRSAAILSLPLPESLRSELGATARRYGVQLLGPSSLGFQRPSIGLNASVLGPLAKPGALGLVSQSGALTASILDWGRISGVSFSTVVSLGSQTSVDLPDVLDFLAHDGQTQSILVYLEGIRDARRFMSALRAAASAKPVVVMKSGRRASGSQAALTHSARIVGSDEVFDSALRRAGAVRVRSFVQLFSAAQCLASRYRPAGRRLAIVTNGGGPGVVAADWTDDQGLEVASLSPEVRAELLPQVSPLARADNLIDLGEDATPAHYAAALQACVKDRAVDGVLVIHSPKAGGDPAAVAQAVGEAFSPAGKPVIACWMGDATTRDARAWLSQRLLPAFRTPEAAVDAFTSIASFYRNQQLLQQTPPPLSHLADPDTEGARLLIEGVLAERRQVLTEMESKALLAAFHIPVTRTMLARTPGEAMLIASQLGYPVALKIDSPDISHKSDVDGVVLNVTSAAQVRDRFNEMLQKVKVAAPAARINGITIQPMSGQRRGREVYIGMTTDDPFGPVITFGAGGTMIELMADRAMELPPLNQFLARRLIERARVSATLGAWRGAPEADVESLEHVLLRVSEMVCALPQLREMDINPLIVDDHGAIAVDARIVVDHAGPSTDSYHHLAILPYPTSFEREWPMKGGGTYRVRAIQPDDAEMLQSFMRGLSEESRWFRFASHMPELPPRMLARFTLIDYDREMALVAVVEDRKTLEDGTEEVSERIIAVSRYATNPDKSSCEFSLAVADEYSGQGLGSRMMLSIIEVARSRGLQEIDGLILANNQPMLRLMASLGFKISAYAEDPDFKLASKAL